MEKHSKIILQTFDYELFSKIPGSAEKCMIEPTRMLISSFDRFGMKTTFFTDILHYVRAAEKPQTQDEAMRIREQLVELISKGHRIELHLHPQWISAVHAGGSWQFNGPSEFSIHNLDDDRIAGIFSTGIQALQDIGREVDPGYEVMAYRGGGWCLQPFSRLKKYFTLYNLKVDSTVTPGFSKLGSDYQYYDFRKAPALETYRFDDDPLVPREDGSFVEIPVSTYRLNLPGKMSRRAAKKKLSNRAMNDKIMGDGKALEYDDIYPGRSRLHRMKYHIRSALNPFYLYTLQRPLPEYMAGIVEADPRNLLNFISHPKNLSPLSFRLLDELGEQGYRFATIKEVYEDL